MQDILLTLHSIRHAYNRTRPFKPWLAGIAQHRVANRLRAGARSAARQVPLGPEHETEHWGLFNLHWRLPGQSRPLITGPPGRKLVRFNRPQHSVTVPQSRGSQASRLRRID